MMTWLKTQEEEEKRCAKQAINICRQREKQDEKYF